MDGFRADRSDLENAGREANGFSHGVEIFSAVPEDRESEKLGRGEEGCVLDEVEGTCGYK
jgi:hypothetical protein